MTRLVLPLNASARTKRGRNGDSTSLEHLAHGSLHYLAADLRRTHRWRLPDAFQAALAQLHGLKLVTRNVRDFPPNKFDFVEVPYTR